MWDAVQDYIKDRAVQNRVDDIRNRGESNASTWDKTVGFLTGTDVEGAVDTFVQQDKNAAVDEILKANRTNRAQLGIGENASMIETQAALKPYLKTERQTEALETANLGFKTDAAKEERRLNRAAIERAERNRLDDRIDARQSENRRFEYQKLQDRKEDRRYNENLARLDMQDRRRAISSMTSGLAALAAAFAM